MICGTIHVCQKLNAQKKMSVQNGQILIILAVFIAEVVLYGQMCWLKTHTVSTVCLTLNVQLHFELRCVFIIISGNITEGEVVGKKICQEEFGGNGRYAERGRKRCGTTLFRNGGVNRKEVNECESV